MNREFDIYYLMDELAKKREIFHSEDDFKFSLAWLIKERYDYEIVLEKPEDIEMKERIPNKKSDNSRKAIDIVLYTKDKIIPIELKYKTKKAKVTINNRDYKLKNQGALSEGRYRFRKDIYRVERFINNNKEKSNRGYVIQLTNDFSYKKNDTYLTDNYDKNYSMVNKILKADLGWNYSDSKNYSKDRKYEPIDDKKLLWKTKNGKKHWTCKKQNFYYLKLNKEYDVNWRDYGDNSEIPMAYCVVEVKPITS